MNRKLTSILLSSSLLMGGVPLVAQAELSASMSIASSYLWRGYDLGSGTPAISADLVYSKAGFYGGMWVSSGDGTAGTEYDLFVGYGGEVEGFSYDIQYITYVYPTGDYNSALYDTEGTPGEFAEVVASVGFAGVTLTYKDNIAGDNVTSAIDPDTDAVFVDDDGDIIAGYALSEDYSYLSLSYGIDDFGFALGQHDDGANDALHFDVTYSYNDNLSFTASAILDSDADEDPDPTFVATYSVPLM